jgi:isopenicillin N synthase-like dioxygenase
MTRARYSIPYFVDPRRDTNVECLPISHGPAKYKPVTYRQYFEERVSEIFET